MNLWSTNSSAPVLQWRPILSDHALMAAKKKQPGDRHKPARMTRVREILAVQLDKLVERNATDFAEEVNRAVRELLIREGLWPPTSSDD